MITFDEAAGILCAEPSVEDLLRSSLPDVIEVGENDTWWVRVDRRSRKVEIVSKQTGFVVARGTVDDVDLLISPAQVAAARAALVL